MYWSSKTACVKNADITLFLLTLRKRKKEEEERKAYADFQLLLFFYLRVSELNGIEIRRREKTSTINKESFSLP